MSDKSCEEELIEIATLRAEIDDWKHASLLERQGDPEAVTPADLQNYINDLRGRHNTLKAENERLDKEWCQLVESVLGWHPVGQTDFLHQGLKHEYPKLRSRVAELEVSDLGEEISKRKRYHEERDRYRTALEAVIESADYGDFADDAIAIATEALKGVEDADKV